MRNSIIRVNGTADFPRSSYVKNVARDGGFSVTSDKAKARRFLAVTAGQTIARLSNTRMTFDVCPV